MLVLTSTEHNPRTGLSSTDLTRLQTQRTYNACSNFLLGYRLQRKLIENLNSRGSAYPVRIHASIGSTTILDWELISLARIYH